MSDSSGESKDGMLDVSDADFDYLAGSKSPTLRRAAERLLAETTKPEDTNLFSSSI